MVRMVTATAKHPTQCPKHRNQRQSNPYTRKYVLTHTCARQTVGQSVKYGVIDAITRKVIAGVKGNIQNNKNAQYQQRGNKPPGIATRFPCINANGSQEKGKGYKL
ncbi:hypothetical protein D3C78_1669700 [compost metagenome]